MAKRIEFELPEGFVVPEGSSDTGSQFDSLVTLQLKDGGKVCIVALDGYRMPGYQEGDKQEYDEADKRSYANAATEGSGLEGY